MWPDFIKIKVVGISIERLLNHPQLDFNCDYSKTTTEINDSKLVSQYRFGHITIHKNKKGLYHVIFTGSVHKLWNDLNGVVAPVSDFKNYKGFNGNCFNEEALITVKEHLCQLFDCEESQMVFQNIELGINVVVPFDPKLFIKGLLFHNGTMFEFRYQNNYAQAIHQQYIVKVYNKSQQYGMKGNILRFELKYLKMIALKRFGLVTMKDLTVETLAQVSNRVVECLDEIVYYDYTLKKNTYLNK